MAGKRKTPQERTIRMKDGSHLTLPAGDTEMPDFAQQLRDAIRAAGLTQYRLAKDLKIPQSALSMFMSGKDLRVSTFNKLAHYLGFQMMQNPDTAPRRAE